LMRLEQQLNPWHMKFLQCANL